MIVRRGRRAGQHLTMHQFCNDWITADTDEGQPVVVSPLRVQLDAAEVAQVRASINTGIMWELYTLSDDGLFTRVTAHDHAVRCCREHGTHSMPHKGCILR